MHDHWSGTGPGSSSPAAARPFVSHSSYYHYQIVTDQQAVYPTEYLNSTTLDVLPPHTLNIKVRASIMLQCQHRPSTWPLQWHALHRQAHHSTHSICSEYSGVAGWTSFYTWGHGQLCVTSWRCGDPHSDNTTSNSVFTTFKLPTLCTRKCYQESTYRCMYWILFVIFYVHVLR